MQAHARIPVRALPIVVRVIFNTPLSATRSSGDWFRNPLETRASLLIFRLLLLFGRAERKAVTNKNPVTDEKFREKTESGIVASFSFSGKYTRRAKKWELYRKPASRQVGALAVGRLERRAGWVTKIRLRWPPAAFMISVVQQNRFCRREGQIPLF
jgi:hypothetical protein